MSFVDRALGVAREILRSESPQERRARIASKIDAAQHDASRVPTLLNYRFRYGEFAGHALYLAQHRNGEDRRDIREVNASIAVGFRSALERGDLDSVEAAMRLQLDLASGGVPTPNVEHFEV